MSYMTAARERDERDTQKNSLVTAAMLGGKAVVMGMVGANPLVAAGFGLAAVAKAAAVVSDKPSIAPGFHAMIMESKLAKTFLGATGETPRNASRAPAPRAQSLSQQLGRMDSMIRNAESIEMERTAGTNVALVYPIDQRGRRGKAMQMDMEQYGAFRKKMSTSGVMLSETRLTENGSTTERSLNGLPHSLGMIEGQVAVLPSREVTENGHMRAEAYSFEGMRVQPCLLADALDGAKPTREYFNELKINNRITELDGLFARKDLMNQLPFDGKLMFGTREVSVRNVGGKNDLFEIYVGDSNFDTIIATTDQAGIEKTLDILDQTRVRVEQYRDREHVDSTINGVSVKPSALSAFGF